MIVPDESIQIFWKDFILFYLFLYFQITPPDSPLLNEYHLFIPQLSNPVVSMVLAPHAVIFIFLTLTAVLAMCYFLG